MSEDIAAQAYERGRAAGAAEERERIAPARGKLREAIAILRMAIDETAEDDIDAALPLLAEAYAALPQLGCSHCGRTPARRLVGVSLALCDECADEAEDHEKERWDEARRLGAL